MFEKVIDFFGHILVAIVFLAGLGLFGSGIYFSGGDGSPTVGGYLTDIGFRLLAGALLAIICGWQTFSWIATTARRRQQEKKNRRLMVGLPELLRQHDEEERRRYDGAYGR